MKLVIGGRFEVIIQANDYYVVEIVGLWGIASKSGHINGERKIEQISYMDNLAQNSQF